MRLKSWMEMLSLGTNLYLLSRDKELMDRLTKMSDKARESLLGMFSEKENKIDYHSLREIIFTKLDLLTSQDAKRMEMEIAELRKEIALAEARILAMENHRKQHI